MSVHSCAMIVLVFVAHRDANALVQQSRARILIAPEVLQQTPGVASRT